jgi:hypothetical protein
MTLGRRIIALPFLIWGNLGTNSSYRWPSAFGYTVGAVSVLHSVVALLYDLRVELRDVIRLPLHQFFTEQVLPVIAAPLVYVGIDLSELGKSLVALSGIGAAILANAEFRNRYRLARHLFSEREMGPKIDFGPWDKAPELPKPPSHTVTSRAMLFAIVFLLTYSMAGLLAFAIFVPFGIYFFLRDVRYLLAWGLAIILYAFEHLLAPYERFGDDEYWGTRWFLAVFNRRRALDELLRTDYIDFWRVDLVGPRHRDWNAAKRSLKDGGRVVALALWLLPVAVVLTQALS